MPQRFDLGHSEKVCSHRLRHQGRVSLHRICLREIPLQEYLQLMNPYEFRSVGDYAGQKLMITFISPHLRRPVLLTRYIYGIQRRPPVLKGHEWKYPQLPSGIIQFLRNYDIEPYGYIPGTLSYIPEPGDYSRSIYDVRRHHLSRRIITYGIHDQGTI